jgi:hypothetical protein
MMDKPWQFVGGKIMEKQLTCGVADPYNFFILRIRIEAKNSRRIQGFGQQRLAKYYYKGSFSYYSYKDFLWHLQSSLAFFQLRILSLSMLELII